MVAPTMTVKEALAKLRRNYPDERFACTCGRGLPGVCLKHGHGDKRCDCERVR